jgi:hypothetical protein
MSTKGELKLVTCSPSSVRAVISKAWPAIWNPPCAGGSVTGSMMISTGSETTPDGKTTDTVRPTVSVMVPPLSGRIRFVDVGVAVGVVVGVAVGVLVGGWVGVLVGVDVGVGVAVGL